MEIVEAVLDQYEIASVIDRKLPRPTLTDAKYTIWRKASKQVRTQNMDSFTPWKRYYGRTPHLRNESRLCG
jgi:hypothetical protein